MVSSKSGYTLPLLLVLSILVASQDVDTLISEIPPCIAPCYQTVIRNGCGNGDDWACGCKLTSGSGFNTACEAAVYDCFPFEIREAISLVSQICSQEDDSNSPASTTPVSGGMRANPTSGGGDYATGSGPTPTNAETSLPNLQNSGTAPTNAETSMPNSQDSGTAPTNTETPIRNSQNMAIRIASSSSLESVMQATLLALVAAWV